MLRGLACGVAAGIVALGTATVPAAADGATYVVDDDGAQCPGAGFATIGAAVAAAGPGDTVRVCPGTYRERVRVDKPLHLVGDVGAVARLDCLADETTDPALVPVLEPPDAGVGSLLVLAADGVDVAGLVLQGARDTSEGTETYEPAIRADGAYAGQRIHHDVLQDNTLAVELGSNGTAPSRVDHSCLRHNDWGVANQRYDTANVRVDHNDVLDTAVIPFEAGTYLGSLRDARYDHNRTVGSGFAAYLVERAADVTLDHNSVEAASVFGYYLRGGVRDVNVSRSALTGTPTSTAGVFTEVPVARAPEPATGLRVDGNDVEGFTVGILLRFGSGTVGTQVVDNVTSDNRLAGIQVGAGNTGALVAGNTSDRNAYGIRSTGPAPAGHRFIGNSMHDNATLDAMENSVTTSGGRVVPGNTWEGNSCATDAPRGALCERP